MGKKKEALARFEDTQSLRTALFGNIPVVDMYDEYEEDDEVITEDDLESITEDDIKDIINLI